MKLLLTIIIGAALVFGAFYVLKDRESQPSSITEDQNQMQSTQDQSKAQGEQFLAENKDKQGVVTTPSGLQYKIIVAGIGDKPQVTDTVTVHYAGTSIDGTEFDSSYKRNAPTSFPVNAVISGWTEALQIMPAGSTWELYIPSDLAYGSRGAPPSIGPNEVLIFKVELLEVK